MSSLRCLTTPLTSLRSLTTTAHFPLLQCASYSSSSLGKRLLQTHTHTSTPPSYPPPGTPSSLSTFPSPPSPSPAAATATTAAPTRTKFRSRKAALSLTPSAVSQLKRLLSLPSPKLIRVGVKNRGCSGLAYHLEYVDKPGKFDEEVEVDGVKVLIDSKALFSIIGSEMDWVEDKLSARFVFKNPNISKFPPPRL